MRNASLAVAFVLPLAGCASSVTVDDLSSLSHVHNIVLHDERVLIGSHEGLFTPSEEANWIRIGDEFDVMALAEVDGELLASGHPGPGFDFPDPVGLLASSDGGETWEARSLVGEVDFHLLEASGSTVIGVAANYGVLLKSTDSGETWSSLDVPTLSDLAINPDDPENVVLATDTGQQWSSDGGATFSLTRTSVRPTILDWSQSGLFGATDDAVWRWNGESSEWELIQGGYPAVYGIASSNGNLAIFDGETVSTIHVKN